MRRVLFAFPILFLLISVIFAEVPKEIRYNGRLKSYQTPVSKNVNIVFKLYDSETGGNSIFLHMF